MPQQSSDEPARPAHVKRRARGLLVVVFWAAVAVTAWFAFGPAPDGGVPGRDKIYHLAAFAALGVLAALAYPGAGLVRLGVLLLAGGVLIELVQALPAVGRDPSAADVLADAGGVALAGLVAAVVRRAGRNS